MKFFFFYITLFNFIFLVHSGNLEDLYETFSNGDSRSRKLALGKASKLDHIQLEEFLLMIKDSNDPELKLVYKKLELVFRKMKKVVELPLPDDVLFFFPHKNVLFESMAFRLEIPEEQYSFNSHDLVLSSIEISGKKVTQEKIRILQPKFRRRSRVLCFDWFLNEGADTIFPNMKGTYQVKLVFQTPDSKWYVERNFERVVNNPQAAESFIKKGLQFFLNDGFYEIHQTRKLYDEVIEFLEMFPESELADELRNNFLSMMDLWISGDFESVTTMKYVVDVLNKSINNQANYRLFEHQRWFKKETDAVVRARISFLEKFLSPKVLDLPDELELYMPKVINSRELKQFLILLKSGKAEDHSLSLFSVKINGVEQVHSHTNNWLKIQEEKRAAFPEEYYLPQKIGTYSLSLSVFWNERIVQFKPIQFEVKVTDTERAAYKFFVDNKIDEIFKSNLYSNFDFSNLIRFLKYFPKSYLVESIKERCQEIVIKDLRGHHILAEVQKRSIAKFLLKKNNAKIFKEIVRIREGTSLLSERMPRVNYWAKILENSLSLAPKGLSLVVTKDSFLPYQTVDLKFFKEKLPLNAHLMKFISVKVNGEDYFNLQKRSSRLRRLSASNYFRNCRFNEAGEYEIEVCAVVDNYACRLSKFVVNVDVPESEKAAYKDFPVDRAC